ncbi:SCO family protein [Bacillus sp. NPDC077027]|uniref:SCO family protein n=1 Tax=Bacillus sp. NPDC077027 TaxID=3390548 RepID=UPI003D025560
MNQKRGMGFGTLMIISVLLLVSCSGGQIKNALNYQIEPFEFQNQEGQKVSLESLKGKVWIADFIFTSCETICPPMTAHMTELQKRLKAEKLDAHIISFSVDPEVDSGTKLKEFADQYPLSYDNWDFLTGYSQATIEKFAMKSFKTIVKKPEDEDQVIHQSLFFLVNQEGKVMKNYDGVQNTPYDEMIKDIRTLTRS